MSSLQSFRTGRGMHHRRSHIPPIRGAGFPTQASHSEPPHFPFQPLPQPNGDPPFRYDLSQLLSPVDITGIKNAGVQVFHTVGDTGDPRGQQQRFVADLMTQDSEDLSADKKPAFLYHLGDVVYFAGDISKYPANFYATYEDYPAFIVAIPGNHDCQPDDPEDGIDPDKVPLDGWVKNFMSKTPHQLGAPQTSSGRTQMDLPNVYWTFTTPFATIIGLFSNVSETQGEFHQDQIDWFRGELSAADPNIALIVAVHHPPFSGDTEHSGSSVVEQVLFDGFDATQRYPNLILSGHVHNYQRFTKVVTGPHGPLQIPCVVSGAGGYTNLRPLVAVPELPLELGNGLSLAGYDHRNFGFLRLEVSKANIIGTYLSAPYSHGADPRANVVETFVVDLATNTVRTDS